MILAKEDLELAFRMGGALDKPKEGWGEWFLIDGTRGYMNQGHHLRVHVPMSRSRIGADERLVFQEWTIRNLLSNLDGEITALPDGHAYIKLEAGRLKSKIPTLSWESYPAGPQGITETVFTGSLAQMKEAISHVEFAIASDADSARKLAFTGLSFKKNGDVLELIGARDPLIAVSRIPLGENFRTLGRVLTFPKEVSTLIRKLPGEELKIHKTQNGWAFQAGGIFFFCAAIPEELAEIGPIFDCPTNLSIKVASDALRQALRQVSIFREKTRRIVSLALNANHARFYSTSQISGRAEAGLPARVEGLEVDHERIGLDLEYLGGIVERIQDPEITIAFGTQRELARIENQNGNQRYITVTASPDPEI